jgi:CheY-like chemotaxis protein
MIMSQNTQYAPTVLVVEDETPLQHAIEIKLKNEGYKVIITSNADEATKILISETPDLIWLDLLLPGMDGLEFLEIIRKNDRWKNIPVIVVSVTAGQDKIKQAFDLNVVDFIIKSQYRLEDIITRVKEFLVESGKIKPQ